MQEIKKSASGYEVFAVKPNAVEVEGDCCYPAHKLTRRVCSARVPEQV